MKEEREIDVDEEINHHETTEKEDQLNQEVGCR